MYDKGRHRETHVLARTATLLANMKATLFSIAKSSKFRSPRRLDVNAESSRLKSTCQANHVECCVQTTESEYNKEETHRDVSHQSPEFLSDK